jgi:hypothetical protein
MKEIYPRPPWLIPDDEYYQEVKRSNTYTWAGLEETQDFWFHIVFFGGLIGYFILMWSLAR